LGAISPLPFWALPKFPLSLLRIQIKGRPRSNTLHRLHEMEERRLPLTPEGASGELVMLLPELRAG